MSKEGDVIEEFVKLAMSEEEGSTHLDAPVWRSKVGGFYLAWPFAEFPQLRVVFSLFRHGAGSRFEVWVDDSEQVLYRSKEGKNVTLAKGRAPPWDMKVSDDSQVDIRLTLAIALAMALGRYDNLIDEAQAHQVAVPPRPWAPPPSPQLPALPPAPIELPRAAPARTGSDSDLAWLLAGLAGLIVSSRP